MRGDSRQSHGESLAQRSEPPAPWLLRGAEEKLLAQGLRALWPAGEESVASRMAAVLPV